MALQIQDIPIFNFTKEISSICNDIDTLLRTDSDCKDPKIITMLRKSAHIKSINSSLAIEGNGLDWKTVRDTIDGKNVEGSFDEIVEVKNAVKAYKYIEKADLYSVDCFLRIESIMMWALTESSGFRDSQVVVSDGEKIYYKAPDAGEVAPMMDRLFEWCGGSGYPLYLTGAIAHFYIESIHPLRDGNGRMGRYWHNAFLLKSSRVFGRISIENAIRRRQEEYYAVLERCQKDFDCTEFVRFMLELTADSLRDLSRLQDPYISAVLRAMDDTAMTSEEIMNRLKLKDRGSFQKRYLRPAVESGFVAMTEPDNPRSRRQRYRKLVMDL